MRQCFVVVFQQRHRAVHRVSLASADAPRVCGRRNIRARKRNRRPRNTVVVNGDVCPVRYEDDGLPNSIRPVRCRGTCKGRIRCIANKNIPSISHKHLHVRAWGRKSIPFSPVACCTRGIQNTYNGERSDVCHWLWVQKVLICRPVKRDDRPVLANRPVIACPVLDRVLMATANVSQNLTGITKC